MSTRINRREFLNLSALTLGGSAIRPFGHTAAAKSVGLIGRVAYESVSVFDAPRLNAATLTYRFRDELINIIYPVTPLAGPAYNPLWYRVWGGYVHSAFIQPVGIQYNETLSSLPEAGRLFRLTIPFARPYTYNRNDGWQAEERYLLYFDSNHWVTDIVEGPDGEAWYQITEAWEQVQYYAPATFLQPYEADELSPIATDVAAADKRIEISLALQQLTAYEGDEIVLRTSISSGVRDTSSGANDFPTETPTGTFNISSKVAAKYMGASRLTDNLGDRFLPGVPWTAYFAEGGYAIHGAYWHNNFGAPMSRGCINVRPEQAQWLYRWMTPIAQEDEWEARGYGTRVIIS
ncbi:MAG: L,D-transpeptidase [Chloroflexi bacterium]|nr:L,D-transpeptidase [Chloroflexota bacterium]